MVNLPKYCKIFSKILGDVYELLLTSSLLVMNFPTFLGIIDAVLQAMTPIALRQ